MVKQTQIRPLKYTARFGQTHITKHFKTEDLVHCNAINMNTIIETVKKVSPM